MIVHERIHKVILLFSLTSFTLGQKIDAIFEDSFRDCEDFENTVFDFSQVRLIQESADKSYLSGNVTLNEDLHEGLKFKAEVYLDDEGTDEYMFEVVGDFCSQITDEESCIIRPIMSSMGLTECPIKKGEYSIYDVTMDTSHVKKYLVEENCGRYKTILSFLSTPDTDSLDDALESATPKVISCHETFAQVMNVAKK